MAAIVAATVFGSILTTANRTASADPITSTSQTQTQTETGTSESTADTNASSSSSTGDTSNDSSDDSEDTCESTLWGFGWIFCPGQTLVGNLINIVSSAIDKAMNWTVLANNADKITPVWQNFLNVANIIFTIAFILMIISTALPLGPMSNYDVKRLLPRLLLVAVLVNLSFYVCAAMVDISNIAGKGVYGLLTGQLAATDSGGTGATISSNITDLFADVLVTGAGVVVAFILGGTIVISIIVILLAISVRQIALMVLVIASPIIFALYVLPNTEKTAAKIMDLFVRLLIVYPMFMAVWGGARLVNNLIIATGSVDPILQIIATAACSVAPAVAIVPLFNMSGGLMKATIGAMNRPAGKVSGLLDNMQRRSTAAHAVKFMGKHSDNKLVGAARRSVLVNKVLSDNDAFDYAAKVDKSALSSASSWANSLDSEQLAQVVKNGAYVETYGRNGDKTRTVTVGDNYRLRAAAAAYGGSMSASDVHTALTYANNRANWLDSMNRHQEAAQLRKAYADAAIASGKSVLPNAALSTWGNSVPSSNDWHSNFDQKYAEAVASRAKTMTAKDLAQMSDASRKHMADVLSRGEYDAEQRGDAAMQKKMADAQANLVSDRNEIHADTKQGRKLRENNFHNKPASLAQLDEFGHPFRTGNQQRYAHYFNLDTTYRYYNMTDNPTAQQYAVDHIQQHVMGNPDYGKLSDFDKKNVDDIAQNGTTDGHPTVREWNLSPDNYNQ